LQEILASRVTVQTLSAANQLREFARRQGLGALRGEYIPTAKNGLVRDHYARLGFTQLGGDDAGRTFWELRVDEGWTPQATFLTETHFRAANPD